MVAPPTRRRGDRAADPRGACGGTHRLYGLAYGCQRRLRANGQLDGPYLRADKYVRDYQNFALTKLQNRDGSFSTEWFKYMADRDDDIDRKIQTTGHILEWLVSSLDQDRLYESRVVAAAEYLCGALMSEPSREWKIGPPRPRPPCPQYLSGAGLGDGAAGRDRRLQRIDEGDPAAGDDRRQAGVHEGQGGRFDDPPLRHRP